MLGQGRFVILFDELLAQILCCAIQSPHFHVSYLVGVAAITPTNEVWPIVILTHSPLGKYFFIPSPEFFPHLSWTILLFYSLSWSYSPHYYTKDTAA